MSLDGPWQSGRVLTAAALIAAALYFAVFAAVGLGAYFTLDDGGNLLNAHGYWENSPGEMAGSVLRVATGAYRPVGGIFYLAIYKIAGFHPLPFRAVCLALMLANVVIGFVLLNRLSGSIETAFLGTLLWAHHPALFQLLFNTGTIYEICCFLFYFAALAWYVHWRRQGILSWARTAGVLELTALALNSKEMAVTLPVALALFELTYCWPERWTWQSILRQGRAVLATALLTTIVMAVKLATYNPLSRDPRYHIIVSVSGVIEALCRYFDALIYRESFLTPVGLLAICAAMLALAHALRSRPMKFGFWFLVISLAPVCIIPIFRNGFMLYIPMIGWSLYWGTLWTRAGQFVTSRIPHMVGVAIRATSMAAI
ncbi:MAG TPA: hypothetical protein VGP79_03120, partial [Bryobacteraceae bacterium]|nr:hypothetical protein [Bryobacteraceae bacterium]